MPYGQAARSRMPRWQEEIGVTAPAPKPSYEMPPLPTLPQQAAEDDQQRGTEPDQRPSWVSGDDSAPQLADTNDEMYQAQTLPTSNVMGGGGGWRSGMFDEASFGGGGSPDAHAQFEDFYGRMQAPKDDRHILTKIFGDLWGSQPPAHDSQNAMMREFMGEQYGRGSSYQAGNLLQQQGDIEAEAQNTLYDRLGTPEGLAAFNAQAQAHPTVLEQQWRIPVAQIDAAGDLGVADLNRQADMYASDQGRIGQEFIAAAQIDNAKTQAATAAAGGSTNRVSGMQRTNSPPQIISSEDAS